MESELSLWVLMAILLACFTAVLAFICLQFWCIRCHEPRWSYRAGHREEANGLVQLPEEVPALDQQEEEPQGLPLVEMGPSVAAKAEEETGVDPEDPSAEALASEERGPLAILFHLG